MTTSNPAAAQGAGAMISTLANLKIWAQALATGTLLTPATQRDRLQTNLLATGPGVHHSYAWASSTSTASSVHNGAIFGYTSPMFYLPKRYGTIVLLGNNSGLETDSTLRIFISLAKYLFPQQFPGSIA